MLVYATVADLIDADPPWIPAGDTPANVVDLLRSATVVIARATQLDPYGPDAPGVDAAPVLRDATCAQVKSWISLKVDPANAGADMLGPVKRSALLSATIERDTTAAVARYDEACRGLAPQAEAILYVAGLLYVAGPSQDTCANQLPRWGSDRGPQGPIFGDTLTGEFDARWLANL